MTIWNILYVAAAVILLFGAAIFVHEFGHYWVARRRGMKVEAFAIGFGPKICGWTKDGIEYSWRWIPAGGFVKLPQMITSDALEGTSKEPIPPAAPLDKILVAFAGPFMNVVFAIVIATFLYFVGLPMPDNPPVVGHVNPQSEEFKAGVRAGDRIVLVNGRPVKTWNEAMMSAALARTNVMPVVVERRGERHTFVLTAKVDEVLGLKMFDLESDEHQIIGDLKEGWPAEKAGLQSKDRIVSFAGVPVLGREQLMELINKRPDVECELVIERVGQRMTLKITPRLDPEDKKGRIGIVFANTKIHYTVQKPGPTPWEQVSKVFGMTFDTLGALFHSKQTGVGIKDLSGPPGILAMLAAFVNTDYRLALSFLVLLNINLAIINLLPIPVLDGGHILMALIEKVFRRAISPRLIEYTTTVFAVLLISLMVYVSFNDVKRFRLFKSMFERGTQVEPAEKTPASPGPTPEPSPVLTK